MNLRRMTAVAAITALTMGITAGPALAKGSSLSAVAKARISQNFSDMAGFEWGLNHVVKMQVKGIFKGRAEGVFAPGAKINHQEAAVATVRLLGKEADMQAMSQAEVDLLLKEMPDQAEIAAWARASVAMLIKLNAVYGKQAFAPAADATRLDIAVMLVKSLGYEAEAQAKMESSLTFKDAHLIPAALSGYVAAAVDHQLITGYEDVTFRPNQAVKRVEMAVMIGRADGQVERRRQDEVKGTVKSVDAATNSLIITVKAQQEVRVELSGEASVFVDNQEKSVSNLQAGMKVEAKLDASGKALYVEARTTSVSTETTVSGAVSALTPASLTSLAVITVNGVAYPVSPLTTVTLNGETASFADLRAGDTISAKAMMGVVLRLEATRAE